MVFSTSVEVFLAPDASLSKVISLLHVRGGVSWKEVPDLFENLSSPRPWRCFCDRLPFGTSFYVFSTSVEVFLRFCPLLEAQVRLLHVRGGVSFTESNALCLTLSSPRPWRCFGLPEVLCSCDAVFSTSVEVFLSHARAPPYFERLLHVRGGVSVIRGGITKVITSSPRPWRCF